MYVIVLFIVHCIQIVHGMVLFWLVGPACSNGGACSTCGLQRHAKNHWKNIGKRKNCFWKDILYWKFPQKSGNLPPKWAFCGKTWLGKRTRFASLLHLSPFWNTKKFKGYNWKGTSAYTNPTPHSTWHFIRFPWGKKEGWKWYKYNTFRINPCR